MTIGYSGNLVDSCGWLEYFADGNNADFFAAALEDTDNLIVPTLCITEVFKVLLNEKGESTAQLAILAMGKGKIVTVLLVLNMPALVVVMRPALNYFHASVLYTVNQTICFINTAAPISLQLMFQRFGFAYTVERAAFYIF